MPSGIQSTFENLKKELIEWGMNDYKLISNKKDYVDSSSKIILKHLKCGYEWSTTRKYIKSGTRCPKCSKKLKYTDDDIKNIIREIVSDEYEVQSKYISSTSPLYMKHNKCGTVFKTTFNRFVSNGARCFHCYHKGKNIRMSQTEFQNKIDLVHGEGNYTAIDKYINKTTYIKIRHNTCGHIWKIDPYHLIDDSNGCPICKFHDSESKDVKKIKRILNILNIKYIQEFKLCKQPDTKRFLRADFYLPEFNAVIEYDGAQHFKVAFNKGKSGLLKTQKRDKYKNNFMIENNIPFLRIKYTESPSNFKKIIKNFIKSISSEK